LKLPVLAAKWVQGEKLPDRSINYCTRAHLKNRILVQDRGGAEFSSVAGFPA
jgi:hypothetical protein